MAELLQDIYWRSSGDIAMGCTAARIAMWHTRFTQDDVVALTRHMGLSGIGVTRSKAALTELKKFILSDGDPVVYKRLFHAGIFITELSKAIRLGQLHSEQPIDSLVNPSLAGALASAAVRTTSSNKRKLDDMECNNTVGESKSAPTPPCSASVNEEDNANSDDEDFVELSTFAKRVEKNR